MKAIEIKTKTDESGNLRLDHQLGSEAKKVRVIILLEEENEEETWLAAASSNAAFNFLKDPEEDIYTLEDGKSLGD